MILDVRVCPKSSRRLVKKEGRLLKVYLTSPAQDGLANKQLIEVLAGHFKVKKYNVEIIAGRSSRNKVVKIDA